MLSYTPTQAERLALLAPGLLSLCHELHALLWHYDLWPQKNGVDWGDPQDLRREYIQRLEALFAQIEEKRSCLSLD